MKILFQLRQLGQFRNRLTSFKRLREILNSDIVILEGGAVLMVKPSKLLKYFSMLRICFNDMFISVSCTTMLIKYEGKVSKENENCSHSSVARKRVRSGISASTLTKAAPGQVE